jgi:TIR domain/HEAT repeats
MTAWNVFYSYAHEDEPMRERLATHLAPLVQKKRMVEWCDRQILPGGDWDKEISDKLDSAHLILLLVSPDFLASDYCFGVEIERSLARLKAGSAHVVPVLLRSCLWQESRFSELQMIPRDGKPVSSWASADDALVEVAQEIRTLILTPPPLATPGIAKPLEQRAFDTSLDLVRAQVSAYARLYERTRQRMRPSHERTHRMEAVFARMREIATASYPLLGELVDTPAPGERLAAVSILQAFASEKYLPFLVQLVGSEKPYVGFHAIKALQFAVEALEPRSYPLLAQALKDSKSALDAVGVDADSDRLRMLVEAEQNLRQAMESLTQGQASFD